MKNQWLISMSLVGVMFATVTYASDTCPEPAWTGTGKVQRVEVSQSNRLRVKFDWNANVMDLCDLAGASTGAFPVSAEVCQSWLSLAMTAHTTGKNMILKHNQPNCYPWTGSIGIFTTAYVEI